jgi:hypothetical protein
VADIQTVSIAIASASVVAGVIYYALQIRNQSRIRQTDLTMRLYQQLGSETFMNYWRQATTREEKDYNEYVRKDGAVALLQVSTYFEGVGILLHRKLLDIDMAIQFFGEPAKMIWEKNEAVLKEMHSDKCFWFEYLYNEIKKREQQVQSKPNAFSKVSEIP